MSILHKTEQKGSAITYRIYQICKSVSHETTRKVLSCSVLAMNKSENAPDFDSSWENSFTTKLLKCLNLFCSDNTVCKIVFQNLGREIFTFEILVTYGNSSICQLTEVKLPHNIMEHG